MNDLDHAKRMFIVTGAPTSGKTALVRHLASHGLAHVPDGRPAVMHDQLSINGEAVPWADRRLYTELLLAWELRAYREARDASGPVICDRGLPDIISDLRLSPLSVPPHVRAAADVCRYSSTVFVTPPSEATDDMDQRESRVTGGHMHRAVCRVYAELGYRMITLPHMPVSDQADFVRRLVESRVAVQS